MIFARGLNLSKMVLRDYFFDKMIFLDAEFYEGTSSMKKNQLNPNFFWVKSR